MKMDKYWSLFKSSSLLVVLLGTISPETALLYEKFPKSPASQKLSYLVEDVLQVTEDLH